MQNVFDGIGTFYKSVAAEKKKQQKVYDTKATMLNSLSKGLLEQVQDQKQALDFYNNNNIDEEDENTIK